MIAKVVLIIILVKKLAENHYNNIKGNELAPSFKYLPYFQF